MWCVGEEKENSMSHSFHEHQGFYNFSNVYERSATTTTKHEEMLRIQGFEPQQVEVAAAVEPPPAATVYDDGDMLTEIISYPSAWRKTATEILDDQIQSSNYRSWPQKEQQQQLLPQSIINDAEVIKLFNHLLSMIVYIYAACTHQISECEVQLD